MINSQVAAFFKFLSASEKAVFTCAIMNDKHPVKGYGVMFVSAAEVINGTLEKWFEEACAQGNGALDAGDGPPTLHTTLNQTSTAGRRTAHIIGCRVLCVDLDREVSGSELEAIKTGSASGEVSGGCGMVPQLIVESSPGRYHLYWKISPCIPLERWRLFQLGLAWKLKGDKAVAAVTAMIRVPGFERITKKGQVWVPEIIWRVENPPELTEKGVLAKCPKIEEWGEKGAQELAEERQRAGKLASEALRARRAGGAPTTLEGRNTYLYTAVRTRCYDLELEYEHALELAEEINKTFSPSLDNWEVKKTTRSAWEGAQRSLRRKAQREKDAIDVLVGAGKWEEVLHIGKAPLCAARSSTQVNTDSEVVMGVAAGLAGKIDSVLSGGGNGNGSDGDGALTRTSLTRSLPALAHRRPRSLFEAGVRLGGRIWSTDGKEAVKLFCACRTQKQWVKFGEYLCKQWKRIGTFGGEGPGALLEGKSRWGSKVYFRKATDKEAFQSIISTAVAVLINTALAKGEERLRKKIGKTVTQAELGMIGKETWAIACNWSVKERQPGDVIVFQNGVLELESGRFVKDDRAPLRWSHPVWCRWDEKTAAAVLGGDGSGAAMGSGASLGELVPVFCRYMQDWFPGDRGIVTVLLRFFGYCMTTDYGRQTFAFFYGPTRAGKGSLCRLACALVGDANYYSANYDVLEPHQNFKSAGMYDKLLISIEEAESEIREADKRFAYLKKLLGGEKVTFERKYAHPFNDQVVGKFVIQSNEPPRYQDKGHSVRSRMICVGFERSFEMVEEFVNPTEEILKVEADKVGTLMALAWMKGRKEARPFEVQGCRALEKGREEVADSIDIVGTFVRNYCKLGKGRIRTSILKLALEVVIGVQEVEVPGRLDMRLRQEISATLFGSKWGVFRDQNGKNARMFENIVFDWEKFKLDWEEECQIGSVMAVKYQELIDVIGSATDATIQKEEL